jgi:hypothetical protein
MEFSLIIGGDMQRFTLTYLLVLTAISGCVPAPTPQENYETALKNLERSEARLDNLRPAYDAARDRAAQAVCQEIAGATPETSAEGAIKQLEGLLSGNVGTNEAVGDAAGDAADKKPPVGDADAALDQLLGAHKQMQEQAAALTEPITKARETMKLINTPGTAEAKLVAERIATLPEVKAYLRQEKRVERMQQAVDEAEALLPSGAAAPAGEPVK